MKQFHLVKGRFLFDDYESGLHFDLAPVMRNPGDENEFNARIDSANDKLVEDDPANQKFLCTVFLNEDQMYKLSDPLKVRFGSKSYLLLYRAGFAGVTLPTNSWFSQGSGGMVCDPTGTQSQWRYFTNWTANDLRHRFRRVTIDEVNAYVDPNAVTPPPPPPDTGGDTDVPPVVTGDGFVHVRCPYCLKTIF
jgi:hypothetical protein